MSLDEEGKRSWGKEILRAKAAFQREPSLLVVAAAFAPTLDLCCALFCIFGVREFFVFSGGASPKWTRSDHCCSAASKYTNFILPDHLLHQFPFIPVCLLVRLVVLEVLSLLEND